MSEFQRYAVYYLPEPGALARFGASWLGWDVASGTPAAQPPVDGCDLAEATATPRKYGFHGTLKPPFRLAAGRDEASLQNAVSNLAARLETVNLESLRVAALGKFLALVPGGDASALSELAFTTVRDLDAFRAPPSEAELLRRRASGLSARQDELLLSWGYPYVGEEFRFHMTLSGKLDPHALSSLQKVAEDRVPPLPRPYPVTEIALVGERADGMFQLIQRYTLTG